MSNEQTDETVEAEPTVEIMSNEKEVPFSPGGFYVLIEVEEVEKIPEEFVESSSVIMAPPKTQKETEGLNKREQSAQAVGTLISIGPCAFSGYAGVHIYDDEGNEIVGTAEQRLNAWGVSIGDRIQCESYDGKTPTGLENTNYRIITDEKVLGRYIDD